MEKRTRQWGGGGDPFLLISLSRNPWLWDRTAVVLWGRRLSWERVLGHQPREHNVPKCAGRRPFGLAASQTAASPASLPHIPRLPCPAPFLRFDVTAVSRPLFSTDGSRPGYCGDREAGQPERDLGAGEGLLERWTLLSMQEIDMEVEVGQQGLPVSGEITPKSLKRAEDEEK